MDSASVAFSSECVKVIESLNSNGMSSKSGDSGSSREEYRGGRRLAVFSALPLGRRYWVV